MEAGENELTMLLVALGLIVLRQGIEMAAKAIPDSATGLMGLLRQALKILALYIPNKTGKTT